MRGPFRQGWTRRLTSLAVICLYAVAGIGVVPAPGAFAIWMGRNAAPEEPAPPSACCGGLCCCGGPEHCRCGPALPPVEPAAQPKVESATAPTEGAPAPRWIITSPDCRDTTAWLAQAPPPACRDDAAVLLTVRSVRLPPSLEPSALTPMPAEPPTPPPRA